MTRHRRDAGGVPLRLLSAGLAAIVVLGACSGHKQTDASGLARASTTTGSTVANTTVPPLTTTTSAPAPVATTAPRVTSTTKATTPPRPLGDPRVLASPPGADPEALISIAGDGFTAGNWRSPNVPLWLAGGPSGCDFFAEADHHVAVTAEGHLAGWFVVPSHGICRQGAVDDLAMAAGHYRIAYQCTACTIGEFDVTVGAPPAIGRCQGVAFAPNSDDVAADIVAYGVSCTEAEAVVRKVGAPLGPVNGAPEGQLDGFTCRRTGQQEGRGLPSATYECTRGDQRITFTRT